MRGHVIVVVTAIAVGLCVDALYAQTPGQESGTLNYQLPRVAVVGFTNRHHDARLAVDGHERLADNLEAALKNIGRFEIVKRQSLSALLPEKKRAPDDILADLLGSVMRLKEASVDYLVTGSLEGDDHATTAIAEFVRATEPGLGTIAYQFGAVGITPTHVGYLAYQIAEKTMDAFPGRVVGGEGDSFVVDLGTRNGIKPDDELLIQKLDAYQMRVTVARGRVTQSCELRSRVQITERPEPGVDITKGMEVRSALQEARGPAETAQRRIVVSRPHVVAPLDAERDGEWFASELTSQLGSLQTTMAAQVLEREHIGRVYEELALNESPFFDWGKAVQAGSLLGATMSVSATLAKTGDEYRATVRVDDQEEGCVLLGTEQRSNDLEALAESAAQSICSFLQPPAPQPLAGDQLVVSVGLNYDVIPTGQYAYLPRMVGPLVTGTITNKGDRLISLRAVVELSGLTARPITRRVSIDVEPSATEPVRVTPCLDQESVDKLTQPKDGQVRFLVCNGSDQEHPLYESSYPVRILPPDIWVARQKRARAPAVPWRTDHAIVAWISQSKAIHSVRGKAAGLSRVGILGYQESLPGHPNLGAELRPDHHRLIVQDQVKAVYKALHDCNIRYVDQPAISFPNDGGQSVLRPAQVLDNRGANCLDGSVLFASALAPSIHPLLVITTNHAFVGWRTWKDRDASWDVLETTQLASADFEAAVAAGRAEAEKVGILDLLNGNGPSGPLTFQDTGLPDEPPPNDVVLIDVMKALSFFQVPVPEG